MKNLLILLSCSFVLFTAKFNFAPKIQGLDKEKKLVIGIASYNNENYIKKNLDSIFLQNYSNFRIIYSNDASTDRTWECLKDYVEAHGIGDKVTMLMNETNQGAMFNHYTMVSLCEDDEIYISLDGDDWFAHRNVLNRINQAYLDERVWMTYGNEILFPSGRLGLDRRLMVSDLAAGKHRLMPFVFAPPRSFYASLFKRIPVELFQDDEGNFFESSCDVAYMFNLLDMVRDHVYFIDEVLYVYNIDTGINDFKTIPEKQILIEETIRKRKPLEKIENWQ
jgi:glycosyltransferase involved in cell wall biosynthesis